MFPYNLSHPKLNFSCLDIESLIYTSDIPPKDMLYLLTVKWGAHEKLALALVDVFGGNIYFLVQALKRATEWEVEPKFYIHPEFYCSVNKCLAWKGDCARMRNILKLLAETGFAPLDDPEDPIAECINLNNLGGVICVTGINTGVSSELWGSHSYGIVPAGQAMRIAIATKLSKSK